MPRYEAINLEDKFSLFNDLWSPRVVAELNDYQLKLVRIQGTFVWHAHQDTDEVFVVLDGRMVIEFRDGEVALSAGELFVVGKGIEHRPRADGLCKVLLVEPRGVVNTGDSGGDLTAPGDRWI